MKTPPDPNEILAIDGGPPAKQHPDPPMYPGGMLIDQEEEQAVLEVLRARRLFRYYGPEPGPSQVALFEEEFAKMLGVTRSLALSSGTGALMCALQGIGVGPGDEVILPAYTWIASANAVLALGGIPILAEVDESLTLDPTDVESKITPYTRAIMPVHMRGVPCRMQELLHVARKHGLKVVEDVAQADGASYRGRRLGSLGDAGCFSLQFNKIITAGEGGMMTTNNDDVWKRALIYHDVGAASRNHIPEEENCWGINFRMPELLGAVMRVQLRRLEKLLAAMRAQKNMLRSGIQDIATKKGIQLQDISDPEGDAAVSFVFFMDTPELADRVAEALRAENITIWRLYQPEKVDYHVYRFWTPILNQSTWTANGGPWIWARRPVRYYPDMCPRTLDLLGRAVHLHVNPQVSNQETEETIEGLNRVLAKLA